MKAAVAKVKSLEASMQSEGEKLIVASEAKVTEYIGKVDELLKMIEDVKKHGVVTVAAGGAAPAGAAAGTGSAPDAGGEPEADFGFGSDLFATDKW
jgi:pyridoxal biosynthesis lyase PdxS